MGTKFRDKSGNEILVDDEVKVEINHRLVRGVVRCCTLFSLPLQYRFYVEILDQDWDDESNQITLTNFEPNQIEVIGRLSSMFWEG